MSIVYAADVVCDRCGNWIHGTTGPKPSGWSRDTRSQYVDLCPPCLEAFRRGGAT